MWYVQRPYLITAPGIFLLPCPKWKCNSSAIWCGHPHEWQHVHNPLSHAFLDPVFIYNPVFKSRAVGSMVSNSKKLVVLSTLGGHNICYLVWTLSWMADLFFRLFLCPYTNTRQSYISYVAWSAYVRIPSWENFRIHAKSTINLCAKMPSL